MPGTQDEPPKLDHVAPTWFLDYFDRLRGWLRANRIVQGTNCEISDAVGGGKRIDVRIETALSEAVPHPFQVMSAGEDPDSHVPLFKIYRDSSILKSFRVSEFLEITNIDETFEVAEGNLIYLDINFFGGEVSNAQIVIGDPWDEYDNPLEFDDPEAENKQQTHAYALIAYVQAIPDPNDFPSRLESGELQIVQCIRTDIILCRTCHESDTVILPFPYFAAGPIG
jgi:hypothetical protein